MYRSLEVRVRTGFSLLLVGIASLGLSLESARAQTVDSQTPTPAATVPAPVSEPPANVDARPAYSGQQATPETMPTPQQAPPPVVTTEAPNKNTPYTAMPAYGAIPNSGPQEDTD